MVPHTRSVAYFWVAALAREFVLGLLIVAWMEYRDTALRTERDIWAFTKLPTLGGHFAGCRCDAA